jgi:hypothetical protein
MTTAALAVEPGHTNLPRAGILLLDEDLGGGLIPQQGMMTHFLQMLIAEEVGAKVQTCSL